MREEEDSQVDEHQTLVQIKVKVYIDHSLLISGRTLATLALVIINF